jgi:hypothetical protein
VSRWDDVASDEDDFLPFSNRVPARARHSPRRLAAAPNTRTASPPQRNPQASPIALARARTRTPSLLIHASRKPRKAILSLFSETTSTFRESNNAHRRLPLIHRLRRDP